jgi:hypothetical protein
MRRGIRIGGIVDDKELDKKVKFSIFVNFDDKDSLRSEAERWSDLELECEHAALNMVAKFHNTLTNVDKTAEFHGEEINKAAMALSQAYMDYGAAGATAKQLKALVIWRESDDPNLKIYLP